MRWLALYLAIPVLAATYDVTPPAVRQGETMRLHGTGPVTAARLNGRTVKLFHQPSGEWLGLMPVGAEDLPGVYEIQFLAEDGSVEHTAGVTLQSANFPKQNITISNEIASIKPSPGEMETVGEFRKTVTDERYWTDAPFALPLPGCYTSPFGVRRYYNGKPTGDYHGGIDQRAMKGYPVRAVESGVVRIVQKFALHGGTVAVDHGQGVESIYLHLGDFGTTEGARVKRGDVIGYAGSTGRSTAPHLHWSLYVNGVPVNPLQWVSLKACAAPRPASGKRKPHQAQPGKS